MPSNVSDADGTTRRLGDKKFFRDRSPGTPFGEAKTTAHPWAFQHRPKAQNKKNNVLGIAATPQHLGQTFSASSTQKRPHRNVRPMNAKFAL